MMNSRREVRREERFEVNLSPFDGSFSLKTSGQKIKGEIVNVSSRGVCIIFTHPILPETQILLERYEKKVELELRWSMLEDNDYRYGFELVDDPEEDLDLVELLQTTGIPLPN